jgi:hypothetical protein
MEKTQQGEVRLHGHAELMTAYAAVEWIMGFERIREDPLIKLPELEENLQSHINASESDNADWEAEDTTYTLDRARVPFAWINATCHRIYRRQANCKPYARHAKSNRSSLNWPV